MALRKAGANWVAGDRFFDRETDLAALEERVRDGTHTLLTAQRRMGKTSLVRELLRRLEKGEGFRTVFVDLEGADDAADAIAEIATRSMPQQGTGHRVRALFANLVSGAGERVEELSASELKLKLRAGLDKGNWRQKGDGVFAGLAENELPVVLAIDELPILVNRLLKCGGDRIVPEGRQAADMFLSWLRKNCQEHRKIVLIVSGSIGLEPILGRVGLSTHVNVFSHYELKPWSRKIANECLGALAETYGIELPPNVQWDICDRLRCLIPHHVQLFFDCLHAHLRHAGRQTATLKDVDNVYRRDLLGAPGQINLDHYETRLKATLGMTGYVTALNLLTEAAVDGGVLAGGTVCAYQRQAEARNETSQGDFVSVDDVLRQLEHDGYLERKGEDHAFVSGLLEDWWRARHGRHFVSIADRGSGGGS